MEEKGAVSGSTSNRNETGNVEGSPGPASQAASGASGIKETSPDLLKNTPSNIARLEDEIEQCEGRHKYLAHTRSPSDGRDVRWYFCEVPLAENELAASVPRTEIVGKGDYFRFGMRDSLAIEASFLQKEEELLSCWWKEYAECSDGPKEQPSSSKKLDTQQHASSSKGIPSNQLYEVEEERVGVPVRGGLYEVDLVKRHCFPVYWNGENRRVLRGHWFARKGGLDWLPLREDVAEQLEIAYRSQVWHRRTFQPSGLFASRVDLQGSTPGLHALFTGEDDTWEAWLNIDASGFSSVIPLGGNGIKLRRGYSTSHSSKPSQDELRQQKEEEMDDYCSQVPVRHLVFMVHGIGQRLEKSNLVDDVGNFRHITTSLSERHLTSHQRGRQRVLFIPCQWRKGLKLSGETAVEKCTLDGVKGLRVMLSATAHDVLYYMSPIYCQDIINSVSNQLNRLYLKFLKRNPGYDGKVSIYGHSLGSVLAYDILCHQENLSSPFPMDSMYKEHPKHEKSSPDMNNQSFSSNSSTNMEDKHSSLINENSSTNLGDKHSSLINETEDKMGPHDEDKRSVQPIVSACEEDVPRGNTEDAYQVGPVVSAFHEFTGRATNSAEEPCVSINDSERMDEEGCEDTSTKDEVIKLLRAEIDSLKAKIAELELQHCGGGRNIGLHQENKGAPATMPEQPMSDKPLPEQDNSPMSFTPQIKYRKLEFKVDTFFAVGSPLGVFLALRNIRIGIGKGQEYWKEENISEEMPACQLMFNIFHPFDPVAYRIEPLVCKEYSSKRPVIVPYHKGGKRLHIGFQVKVLTACQSRDADSQEEEEAAQEKEERSYGSLIMERLTGSTEGRIDHMLQDKTFQHPYISAIGSHTNYWRDPDTALFILKHLYRDIPEDPTTAEDLKNDESGSKGWYDRRESIEEELPLTFSDQSVVRNFSSKAKKLLNKR
ncbi:phospholipase SGR2 isoform X3 [Ziziphus jujuba]|uniref:Phospholipase SGR2 isoform X3 n=1 Tax=Ziziphus jujuba TaxID=326968 RepID=A0ABM3IM99_ZIZJJ|nr:phospholipase SGR2 isoform X3 [Ziziphus jujuba]